MARANLITRLAIVVAAAAVPAMLALLATDFQRDPPRPSVVIGAALLIGAGLALSLAHMLVVRPMGRLVAAARGWPRAPRATPATEFDRVAAAFAAMAETIDRQRGEAARLRAMLDQRAAEPARRPDHGQSAFPPAFRPAQAGRATELPSPAPTRARLLLVDDDADVRAMAGEMLSEAGYAVVLAGDAADALAWLERDSDFAVMLADYAMPGLNGVMLIETVRARYPAIRPLLLTGYAEVAESGAVPADQIVRKPFTISALVGRVQHVLRDQPAAAPASR